MKRTIPWVRWSAAFVGLMAVLACGGSGDSNGETGYAGIWQVAVGPDPKFSLEMTTTDSGYDFELRGAEVPIAGAATEVGGVLTLEAGVPSFGHFTAHLAPAAGGTELVGTWEVPQAPASGSITATRDPWPTWDLGGAGVPRVGTEDCIDLSAILRLSRFRSGAGHDYSDDFEVCRSMKHYFLPRTGVDFSTIRVFAPLTGTVVGTTEEWDGPSKWKGTAVGIRSTTHPALHVVLFHIDLHQPLAVGDAVVAGHELGTSEKRDGTACDVAFGVMTPAGFRLVSWFEVMTDDVFSIYAARGVSARGDMIVTQAQRDADPLTCDGQEFQSASSLLDWLELN